MRKRIATLEVLAIGAIIALSAAAVAPMVIATDHANTMKCIANGKKIMAGMQQYMVDYDGRFPSGISAWPEPAKTQATQRINSMTWNYLWASGSKWSVTTWSAVGAQMRYVQLRSYVKDGSAWICPAPDSMYAKRYAHGYRMSYALRGGDGFVNGDRGFCSTDGVGRTIAEVEALDANSSNTCGARHMPPHKKIMIMCYGIGQWGANGVIGDGAWPWIFPAYPHERGSVYGYADGHVACKLMGRGWAPIGYTKLVVDSTPTQ